MSAANETISLAQQGKVIIKPHLKSKLMINIDESYLVGKGHHRKVYRHPENDKLCIKVVFDGNHESSEIESEKSYYRHLQKRGISWEMLPVYHGDVTTNLGQGTVFDLVTDTNNEVSKTLVYYFSSSERINAHFDELIIALNLFKQYLLEQRIITKGLAPRNIVCQLIDSTAFKLHIVDNIGNSEFIPISNYIAFRAHKKINKKWIRFKQKLLIESPENTDLKRLIDQIN